ncbi:MAG: hypothetical protein L3J83_08605 [Proteobacteria bacterium]|nr:hypothetical protein [Pseudomonadota bacterium]
MHISKQTFQNLQDKCFEIAFESDKLTTCQLIEVKDVNSHTLKQGQSEPFSLVFETQGDQVFEQNTYLAKNIEMDEFPLFLVPIGADKKGVRYEAVFT